MLDIQNEVLDFIKMSRGDSEYTYDEVLFIIKNYLKIEEETANLRAIFRKNIKGHVELTDKSMRQIVQDFMSNSGIPFNQKQYEEMLRELGMTEKEYEDYVELMYLTIGLLNIPSIGSLSAIHSIHPDEGAMQEVLSSDFFQSPQFYKESSSLSFPINFLRDFHKKEISKKEISEDDFTKEVESILANKKKSIEDFINLYKDHSVSLHTFTISTNDVENIYGVIPLQEYLQEIKDEYYTYCSIHVISAKEKEKLQEFIDELLKISNPNSLLEKKNKEQVSEIFKKVKEKSEKEGDLFYLNLEDRKINEIVDKEILQAVFHAKHPTWLQSKSIVGYSIIYVEDKIVKEIPDYTISNIRDKYKNDLKNLVQSLIMNDLEINAKEEKPLEIEEFLKKILPTKDYEKISISGYEEDYSLKLEKNIFSDFLEMNSDTDDLRNNLPYSIYVDNEFSEKNIKIFIMDNSTYKKPVPHKDPLKSEKIRDFLRKKIISAEVSNKVVQSIQNLSATMNKMTNSVTNPSEVADIIKENWDAIFKKEGIQNPPLFRYNEERFLYTHDRAKDLTIEYHNDEVRFPITYYYDQKDLEGDVHFQSLVDIEAEHNFRNKDIITNINDLIISIILAKNKGQEKVFIQPNEIALKIYKSLYYT